MRYEPTQADRAPFPATYDTEPRYLKYRDADESKPYAKYFRRTTAPVQQQVAEALVAGKAATEYGYQVGDVVDRLSRPGYENLETGWTKLDNGVTQVNALTDMPGVTAAMWDWWFGWHSTESARYKLWYPDAHQYSAVGEDRSRERGLTDRQRYVGNVSYVDEYVGGDLTRLAIRFLDPAKMGFADTPGTTHICARVSLSNLPVAFGWIVHQVRPTEHGSEMRSRFFLNDRQMLALPARALPTSPAARAMSTPVGRTIARVGVKAAVARLMPATLGTDMLFHCAAEMNHLAGFLPELHEEFNGTP